MKMMIKAPVFVALALVSLAGCTRRDFDGSGASAAATTQGAPLPTLQPAAPAVATVAPVATPVAAPVATPVAAPVARPAPAAPAQTVVVVQAPAPTPAADPKATCRARFERECTISCNTKVNAQVSDLQKRRIAHDICFGECTRAAEKQCR